MDRDHCRAEVAPASAVASSGHYFHLEAPEPRQNLSRHFESFLNSYEFRLAWLIPMILALIRCFFDTFPRGVVPNGSIDSSNAQIQPWLVLPFPSVPVPHYHLPPHLKPQVTIVCHRRVIHSSDFVAAPPWQRPTGHSMLSDLASFSASLHSELVPRSLRLFSEGH